jgi:MFS family permease
VWREVGAGLRLVGGHPLLRASAGTAGTYNLFNALLGTVYLLYLTRELGIAPAALGVLLAVSGPGSLLGVLLAAHAGRRFGLGPTMIGGIALAGAANVMIPLAGLLGMVGAAAPAGWAAAAVFWLLAAASFANGFGQPFYNVGQVSLRQAITPARFQGRVNATMQFLASATAPLGALAGGALGQAIGLWGTLVVGALGTLAAALWLCLSSVGTLREPPPGSEPAPAAA